MNELQCEIVTSAEAAKYLDVKLSTMYQWSSSGKGPVKPVKVGGKVRWRVSDLKALVAGGTE